MNLPHELVMDNEKETRGLVFTPELQEALPSLGIAFDQVDEVQNADREAYLNDVIGSVFTFKHRGANVTCAALWNNANANPTEAIVTLPPFTDCAPNVGGTALAAYSEKAEASVLDVIKARPNSARQVLKLATTNELEHALGDGVITMAFFSGMPMRAYSASQRREIINGNFEGMTEIVEHGLSIVQDRLHGPNSETQIREIHLAGASQGATQAIATAKGMVERDNYFVKTVTAQELIMGPNSYTALLKGLNSQLGERSDFDDTNLPFIPEPELMHDIDLHGNEPMMFGRMIQSSLLRPANMTGLTKPTRTFKNIWELDEIGVPVTVLLAENSGLTQETPSFLENLSNNVGIITIRGVEGQYADHLADENVNVVATGIALGSRR